jgi:hypothetical protein
LRGGANEGEVNIGGKEMNGARPRKSVAVVLGRLHEWWLSSQPAAERLRYGTTGITPFNSFWEVRDGGSLPTNHAIFSSPKLLPLYFFIS